MVMIKPPLVKKTRLNADDSGKALSDGWVVNFAIGCTFGCPFCYVDSIHRLYNPYRLSKDVLERDWGDYFIIPENLEDVIKRTPWHKWRGVEVLMSSTHDPYLPRLYFPKPYPRMILERALPQGVRFRILTRSLLVLRDLDILTKYKSQVTVMFSIPTLDRELSRIIEPRAPPPNARLLALKRLKNVGLKVGVIIAPIIPRPINEVKSDLEELMTELASIGVDIVYGEMLHVRGLNMERMRRLGINPVVSRREDEEIGRLFMKLLNEYGLKGTYWFEWPSSAPNSIPM